MSGERLVGSTVTHRGYMPYSHAHYGGSRRLAPPRRGGRSRPSQWPLPPAPAAVRGSPPATSSGSPVPPSIAVWRADRVRGETKNASAYRRRCLYPSLPAGARETSRYEDFGPWILSGGRHEPGIGSPEEVPRHDCARRYPGTSHAFACRTRSGCGYLPVTRTLCRFRPASFTRLARRSVQSSPGQ